MEELWLYEPRDADGKPQRGMLTASPNREDHKHPCGTVCPSKRQLNGRSSLARYAISVCPQNICTESSWNKETKAEEEQSNMACLPLSRRDLNILEKIQDPEFDPSQTVQVDSSLQKDPNVTGPDDYESIAAEEKKIVLAVQQVELQTAGLKPKTEDDLVDAYKECLAGLSALISAHPSYASARNNRAQATRRLYGDGMLVTGAEPSSSDSTLLVEGDRQERRAAASQALSDLDTCISLLSPTASQPRMSLHAAKTLSLAHTQRAALYHQTSKLLASGGELDIPGDRREALWQKLAFEGAASSDFAMGGRYGNEISKGLAVSTNPTAKLCGQIVREAMKKEYGPAFSE